MPKDVNAELNFLRPIFLNGSPGTPGQLPTSAGPDDPVEWGDPPGGGVNFLYFDAAEFIPSTTGSPGVNSEETPTHRVNRDFLVFDSATAQTAQVWFAWPAGWNEVTMRVFWKYRAGSGVCVFAGSVYCFEDGDALDVVPYGTLASIEDTGLGANTHHETPPSLSLLPGGTPAEGRPTILTLYRDATNPSDTFTDPIDVMGVLLTKSA